MNFLNLIPNADEHDLEIVVELGISMQRSLNQHGNAVGLEIRPCGRRIGRRIHRCGTRRME